MGRTPQRAPEGGADVEQLVEHLHELEGLGIDLAHGAVEDVSALRPLELMAERVIPALA